MLQPEALSIAGITARALGLLLILPIGEGLQVIPKLFIAVCFAFALAPGVTAPEEMSLIRLAPEFLVGVIIAAPTRFIAESGELFGELIDTARGQTLGSVVDPLNGQQSSDMATIIRIAMVVLAITLGALDRCVEALALSYSALPLGGALLFENALLSILHQGVAVVGIALGFSSVWLVAYLVIDIATGVMAKVTQGVQFTSTATILKMLITFILFLNLLGSPREISTLVGRHTQVPKWLTEGPVSSEQDR